MSDEAKAEILWRWRLFKDALASVCCILAVVGMAAVFVPCFIVWFAVGDIAEALDGGFAP